MIDLSIKDGKHVEKKGTEKPTLLYIFPYINISVIM